MHKRIDEIVDRLDGFLRYCGASKVAVMADEEILYRTENYIPSSLHYDSVDNIIMACFDCGNADTIIVDLDGQDGDAPATILINAFKGLSFVKLVDITDDFIQTI